MARRRKETLTDNGVRAEPEGLRCDGGGLYLRVTRGADGSLNRAWLYRFASTGRERWMGLGAYPDVSLKEARELADEGRRLRRQGIDPIDRRREGRAAQAVKAAKQTTFREAADGYMRSHGTGWRNAKHAAQWPSTLKDYVYPSFGDLPVQAVDAALVLKVLEPIWNEKPETASRVRGRIESVLDWAKARGLREGENPARWRGHLDKLLPARSKVRKVKHHAALPFDALPDFMARLKAQEGVAARALAFTILTGARTGEAIGAQWDEIDLAAKVWTIPANRMKAGREHRVPLAPAAIAILEQAAERRENDRVFPGARGAGLSNAAFLTTLRRMERSDLTAHGFRSTFRDWAAERTSYPREVAEQALAHTQSNKVEAAYRRSDLFDKRRRLMEAWARFCVTPGASSERGGVVTALRVPA
jgi:integrase